MLQANHSWQKFFSTSAVCHSFYKSCYMSWYSQWKVGNSVCKGISQVSLRGITVKQHAELFRCSQVVQMFSCIAYHLYSYSHEQSIANIATLGRIKDEDGQSTVSNTGACSTTSWIDCVKYSMNTLRGLFSVFSKGLCFFSQPESSSKWVGSPSVNLHQHWSQVVAVLHRLQVPPFPCSSATCCIC
jgi:hypothetical protein